MVGKHSYRAYSLAKGRHWLAAGNLNPQINHWTGAASRGVFRESSRSVCWAHSAIFGAFIIVITASNLPMLVIFGVNTHSSYITPQVQESVAEHCGERSLNSCSLGGMILSFAPRVIAGTSLAFLVVIASTPVRFWSPTTLEAAKKENNVRLQRCIRWLLPVTFVMVLWSFQHVAFSLLYLSRGKGSSAAFQYFFFASVLLVVFQVGSMLYFMGATVMRAKGRAKVSPDFLAETGSDVELASLSNLQCPQKQLQHSRSSTTLSSNWMQKMDLDSSPGRRYYTDLLLWLSVYLWTIPELSAIMDGAGILVMWVLRLLGALLFLRRFERPMGFEGLRPDNAGFGLVADAKQLSRVLRAHLKCNESPAHTTINTYRASLFRMRETLAVSYRWQQSEAEISPGVFLNMSPWQMKCLADCIDSCNVLYGKSEQLTLLVLSYLPELNFASICSAIPMPMVIRPDI
eukprot:scaffold66180_cov29-Prasinocladus_malaysianus.AAC.1